MNSYSACMPRTSSVKALSPNTAGAAFWTWSSKTSPLSTTTLSHVSSVLIIMNNTNAFTLWQMWTWVNFWSACRSCRRACRRTFLSQIKFPNAVEVHINKKISKSACCVGLVVTGAEQWASDKVVPVEWCDDSKQSNNSFVYITWKKNQCLSLVALVRTVPITLTDTLLCLLSLSLSLPLSTNPSLPPSNINTNQ